MNKKNKIKSIALLINGILALISTVLFFITIKNSLYGKELIQVRFLKFGVLEGIMGFFFCILGFLIIWASTSMIDKDLNDERIPLYYILITMLIVSLCGIVFFDNLIWIYIFIEMSSFLSAGIVMINDTKENIKAGLKYLLLSILASALFLIGTIILYNISGSFNISEIKLWENTNINMKLVLYSFIFILVGIGFKSALFPFHIWLPDAHGSAPAPSSAILSSLVLKAYIILFIKLIYITFGINLIKETRILDIVLYLGICGMIYGSLLAIIQKDLKRMIAYSSVAQVGYIFMGIGLGNIEGLIASVFHILAHGVTKATLFLNVGTIINKTDNKQIDKMINIGKKLPLTMGLFTIAALSMIGIPLLVGFSSKWNFAQGIILSNKLWVIGILSLSTLLNGLYYLPIIVRAYFNKDSNVEKIIESKISQLPIMILGSLVILLGVFSILPYNLIRLSIERFIF